MTFPSTLLLVCLAAELINGYITFRMDGRWETGRRAVLWTLRPWAGWAAINLLFRNFPAYLHFNDPLTFPFFADLWQKDAGVHGGVVWLRQPGMWMWGCLAVCFATLLILRVVRLMARDAMPRAQMMLAAAGLYVLSLGFTLTTNALPMGVNEKDGSLLRPWFNSGSTMVFDIRVIKTATSYLKDFLYYQTHGLRMHAMSHPPGASLSLYGIGRAFSPEGGRPPMWCYALGLALLATLNIALMLGIGQHVTGRLAGGWFVAALWALSPAAVTYNMFALESYYALFYNAALLTILKLADRPHGSFAPPETFVLGLLFAVIAMLNYNWCLLTTAFTLFAGYLIWARHVGPAEAARWWLVALAVFALLWFGFLDVARLDYVSALLHARHYVSKYYNFISAWQCAIAFVGGQWTLYLMMGPMACSAFVAWLAARARARTLTPPLALYILTTVVYLAAILVMNALKVEAARQFNWLATLPLAFAADHILASRNPKRLAAVVMMSSAVTTLLMRIYLVFWA